MPMENDCENILKRTSLGGSSVEDSDKLADKVMIYMMRV